MNQLYCAAILKYRNKVWTSEFEYFHANSQHEAEFKFRAGNTIDIINGRTKITGIAPVVGYQQDDRSGQIYV